MFRPGEINLTYSHLDRMIVGGIVPAAGRLTIIDNHLLFAMSHMLGARAFEVHLANYWPEWGIKLIDDLAAGRHAEVQRALVREAMRAKWLGQPAIAAETERARADAPASNAAA